ncbi:MAG: cupin domain-containing protein [Myxococcota bacterium]
MRRSRLALLTLIAPLLCAPDLAASPTLDVLIGERQRQPVATLAARVGLKITEDFKVVEIGRDAGTSQHLVAIRTQEIPHRHDRHDLFVVMVRGHGTWRVGDETQPVGENSILYVPRGTVHAFSNQAQLPAIAYAVYVPPFDGEDRVEVPDPASEEPAGAPSPDLGSPGAPVLVP